MMTEAQANQELAVGFGGLFGILAILIKFGSARLAEVDRLGLSILNSGLLGQPVRWWSWLTATGSPLIMGGITVGLGLSLWYRRQVAWAATIIIAWVSGDVLIMMLKHLVVRLPSAQSTMGVERIGFLSSRVFSTTLLTLMVGTLLFKMLNQSWLVWLLVGLLGLWVTGVMRASMGLNNYFPSDVLGSLLLAGGWWCQCVSLHERFWVKRSMV
ncbi:hypothetical protein FD13_GL001942 [Levilactobacillus senmaizukei DSM 21775 = NBRC 103853]|uniref:Membrane-associated phospholipid phosphatase n=1 Tax=Levilactobacillus senmaizukei DSM 21775 = NBRC 103853 TaxID=1423803 RepID=A0A0R2DEP1_9LACO|nr:hypothetical protein FD13_GL001942 [Levilactobacillus senmaizukei DSM 21775 = NBRC 103853]